MFLVRAAYYAAPHLARLILRESESSSIREKRDTNSETCENVAQNLSFIQVALDNVMTISRSCPSHDGGEISWLLLLLGLTVEAMDLT